MKNGTRVIISGTKSGCYGAEGKRGVITDLPHTDGLFRRDPGINVKIDGSERIWRVLRCLGRLDRKITQYDARIAEEQREKEQFARDALASKEAEFNALFKSTKVTV